MNPRIALIHDHLAQSGGAERVLLILQDLFPQATTFTTVWNKKRSDPNFLDKDIRTSFIQSMPFGVRKYQWYLPLMPVAFEHMDLFDYKLIISSVSALAKGVIAPEGAKHVCYCHTPTRYLWSDRIEYVQALRIPKLLKSFLQIYLNYLRVWDYSTAQRIHYFIANSQAVKDRIKHYYHRDSEIIHPPVSVENFTVATHPGSYFLTGGRLTSYKRFDITVQAFSKTRMKLCVYGDGPELEKLKQMASQSPNIKFLGRISEEQLASAYQNALAFINPQLEDFGITMVEAMANGKPVIAYQKGGALDIVTEGESGVFFDEQSWECLADTLIRFDASAFDPHRIRARAEVFSVENFKKNFRSFLQSKQLID